MIFLLKLFFYFKKIFLRLLKKYNGISLFCFFKILPSKSIEIANYT